MYINKVTLGGFLGWDPRVFDNTYPYPIRHLSLATHTYKYKNGEMTEEKTQWHRIVLKPRLSAKCKLMNLRRGDQILVQGQIEYDKWTTPDGEEKLLTNIIAQDLQTLDGRVEPTSEEIDEELDNNGKKRNKHNYPVQYDPPYDAEEDYDFADESMLPGPLDWVEQMPHDLYDQCVVK